MTAADVLDEAAGLIEQRGWWNGHVDGPLGSGPALGKEICAGQAIYKLEYTPLHTRLQALTALGKAVNPRGTSIYNAVITWNDRQPNGEAVAAKMREVAQQLRTIPVGS
jgi:hypothetical protein